MTSPQRGLSAHKITHGGNGRPAPTRVVTTRRNKAHRSGLCCGGHLTKTPLLVTRSVFHGHLAHRRYISNRLFRHTFLFRARLGLAQHTASSVQPSTSFSLALVAPATCTTSAASLICIGVAPLMGWPRQCSRWSGFLSAQRGA